MSKITEIFKKEENVIIGAIHFPPLLGYPDFPGFDVARGNALEDLEAFEQGGVDGIIFENNYDIPHKTFVDSGVVASMTYLGEKIKAKTKLPVGISVLWNDHETALSIAKILDLQFIRIPVFVDKVETDYGIVEGAAKKVIEFRNSIGAENVAIFTDIHVKHAKLLSKHDLNASAKLAMKNGADAIIITGKWTGQSPDMDELKTIRETVGAFPVLAGSGLDENNVVNIFQSANGAIVSTSLKAGNATEEVNVKAYTQRIDIEKVKTLMSLTRNSNRTKSTKIC